jgi:transposase
MTMKKIPREDYAAEFKELAVKRVKDRMTTGAVAKELGLIEQTLLWARAAEDGKLNGAGTKVVTAELMELSRLRVENARLKHKCEILKKPRRTSRERYREVRLDLLNINTDPLEGEKRR